MTIPISVLGLISDTVNGTARMRINARVRAADIVSGRLLRRDSIPVPLSIDQ